jgi:preprotein translocase subunit SecG
MSIVISLLTLVLVVVALLLGLLVLVQLPKKEAGIGAAFGAESTAAIFGANSGTVLTDLTRWLAGIFLVLCLGISVLTAHNTNSQSKKILERVNALPAAAATNVPPPPANALTAPAPAAPNGAPAK